MQQIQIIGNVGEDCVIRDVNSKRFATFRVACTEKVPQGSELVDRTTWYSCSYNKPDARVLEFIKKGVRVFIQGLPSYSIYDSAVNHCKMIDIRVFVDRIQLCSDRRQDLDPLPKPEDDTPTF